MGGENAEDRDPTLQHLYLALHPKNPPSPEQPQLRLLDGVKLRKEGYLCVRNLYRVDRAVLEPLDIMPPGYYRLDSRSLGIVKKTLHTGLPPSSSSVKTPAAGSQERSVHTNPTTASVRQPAQQNLDNVRQSEHRKMVETGILCTNASSMQSEADRVQRIRNLLMSPKRVPTSTVSPSSENPSRGPGQPKERF